MAALCVSAQSRSKCQNPTPVPAQKRPLGRGGLQQVSRARVDIINDAFQGRNTGLRSLYGVVLHQHI